MKHILTLAALVLATSCFGQEACPNVHDINSNGTIDIEDFLSILGLFADVDVDEDGVWDSQDDCLDLEACNYDVIPSEPCAFIDVLGECGGGCEGDGDGDGICDDVDTCVGELDECGVCNGPGPTEVVIEDITILYDSVYAEQIDQWFVFEVGVDTIFNVTCTPTCGAPISYQGYNYETVLIGDQCWFAENLQSRYYTDGWVIAHDRSSWDWGNSNLAATATYGEPTSACSHYTSNGDACDDEWSLVEFGRLYNAMAIQSTRGLCPIGWHVPTDGEWMEMELALGMEVDELNETGWRGTNQGAQLKTTSDWYLYNEGTNTSGFSAKPAGYRGAANGCPFSSAGARTTFWTSTPDSSAAWIGEKFWSRELNHYYDSIERVSYSRHNGYSIRCLKDSE